MCNIVAKFTLVEIIFIMPLLKCFDLSLQCFYLWLIKFVLAACHLKNYFVITYLLEDEQKSTTIFNTCPRRHHSQSTSGSQPSNRESIIVKVHFSMISTAIPKFVHNRGHGFSKRLNPAGVYCFYHRYRPAPCLAISPLPRRLAEWARLQPLPCMNLTQGSLVKRKSSFSASNTRDLGHT